MRLKHVKGARERIEASSYYIEEPIQYKGSFVNIFPKKQPLYLEIGVGKGDFIVQSAIQYPERNFIGIEKYDSVLVKAIMKAENYELPNLKFICMDATMIEEVFEHEIDTLYLNFSDPWPKNRHAHRRLTSPIFLNRYHKIFKDKQHIVMKTDNRKLFEYSIMSFNECGYSMEQISLDLYQDDISDNIVTEYEKKFVSRGNVIYKIEVLKEK